MVCKVPFLSLVYIAAALLLSIEALAQSMRDPTMPLTATVASSERELVLHSIIQGNGRKLAVINGELLHEGDVIAGMQNTQLINISSRSVTVQRNGQQMQLTLVDSYTTQSQATQ
ncbi:general secretion pathway protein GspB [Gilvimarinus sp. DA14]|uniref:general secretion pathway protein GspB n=1 Tax=Gilvimarinus sp. DA14 TaxID=2956798 RepID=UPI0020B89FAB|nr:general secretion pathway protein GspB [Gilvimarinus sp. DA14]UTF61400.1 general secretion pathway protein GspB [Gilvimarinus sp. DA14]